MAYPAPTKGFSQPSPHTAMLFAPYPLPSVPPFLLMKKLSPKNMARYDITKLKVSLRITGW